MISAKSKKIGKRDESLPPLELLSDVELNKPTEEEINTNARIIKNTLLEFDVEVEVIDVKVGPTVTQYADLALHRTGQRRRRNGAEPRACQRDHQPERRSRAGALGQTSAYPGSRARPFLRRRRSARTASRARWRCARCLESENVLQIPQTARWRSRWDATYPANR